VANTKSINGLVFYKPNGSTTFFLPQLVSLDSTFAHVQKKQKTKKANCCILINKMICCKYQLVIGFKYHQYYKIRGLPMPSKTVNRSMLELFEFHPK